MKVVVGISDMKISNQPDDELITYSLGSCIAVVIWDPESRVGGMLHFMLPDSNLDKDRAAKNPFMFADTGVPQLFKQSYLLGAVKERLLVKLFGGSQVMDSAGYFNIGKRNYAMLTRMFLKNRVRISMEDVGGTVNRTVNLNVGTGSILLKIPGRGEFNV